MEKKEETYHLHGCHTYEKSISKVKDEVEGVKARNMKITCEIGEDMLHDLDDMDDYQKNVVLLENEHQETIDSAQGSALSDNFGCFDPGTESHCTGTVSNNEYDIGQDFGVARMRFENELLPVNEMSDSNYRSLVPSLNEKQKLFFFTMF